MVASRRNEGAHGGDGMKHKPHCEKSPTGAHWWVMSWPEPGVYQGVCKYCGHEKQEDANLGMKPMNLLPDGSAYFRGRGRELRFNAKGVASE